MNDERLTMNDCGKNAAIIFDFDDTLVYSHEQFLLTEQAFAARLAELGLYDEGLLPAARVADIANVRRAGYLAADCFPLALAQTYESYCGKYGRAVDEREIQRLLALGRQPYRNRPREMEGARELLEHLRSAQGGRRFLILFTQGEQEIQQQRIDSSGFSKMFDIIKIVREKNDAALQALLQEQSLNPSLSWYVGNSPLHDINPAIRAGLNAVHLNTGGWSYENEAPCGFYYAISKLEELKKLIND